MTTSNKVHLVDTNVLIYATDGTSPFHEVAKDLRDKGLNGDISLCICPQILNEFFAIVTDARRVANPRTQQEALGEVESYFQAKQILKIYPVHGIIDKTLELLSQYDVTGQSIFDLYLIATMLTNNVTSIFTYNQAHFSKFKEVEVVSP